ncbi:hypothetical protein F5879DRAFT_976641 [Lentinula edodes]|nr:hypothetical protein F5879DRAFT_976641 [Lentinula edodes]
MYSTLGANVVVNDVSEKAGGKATTAVCLAEDGETIVKAALDDFGGVHILAMSEQEWDIVLAVHLRYSCPFLITYQPFSHHSYFFKEEHITVPKRYGQCSRSRSTVASSLLALLFGVCISCCISLLDALVIIISTTLQMVTLVKQMYEVIFLVLNCSYGRSMRLLKRASLGQQEPLLSKASNITFLPM